jgi:hypothetical protein
MSVLKKLMLMLPHVEFESPELRQKFTNFMHNLDLDLDNSGFDTSTPTDDMLESLEECLEEIENEVIVRVVEASDEEQEELDKINEELDEDEAATGADI